MSHDCSITNRLMALEHSPQKIPINAIITQEAWSLALQVRKRISASNSFLTTASYQTVDLQDIRLSPVVRRIPDSQGVVQIAKLGASFISDHRDSAVDPKHGLLNTSTFQIAGKPWGSEVNFVSLAHQSSYFRPSRIRYMGPFLAPRAGSSLMEKTSNCPLPSGTSREGLLHCEASGLMRRVRREAASC